LRARPPFRLTDEIELMRAHRIDVLVSKNAGGQTGSAKLNAARELGIPVVMIARPPASEGEGLEGVEAALAWIEAQRTLRGVSR
jgi:precorrin-6A/cobalt-precorrin-6A reductase